MKKESRDHLRRLADQRGKEYGKLVQKLLALALLDAGASELFERSTQGIDLECKLDGRALAIEVKTCESRSIRLASKDLDGLAARHASGARCYLAVLGPGLFDDLRLAVVLPGEIAPAKDILLVELRASRDLKLEARLRPCFERVLLRHAAVAESEGQGGLDALLASHVAYRRA